MSSNLQQIKWQKAGAPSLALLKNGVETNEPTKEVTGVYFSSLNISSTRICDQCKYSSRFVRCHCVIKATCRYAEIAPWRQDVGFHTSLQAHSHRSPWSRERTANTQSHFGAKEFFVKGGLKYFPPQHD